MVTRHPEVVFSQMGEREVALTAASRSMLFAFDAVLQRVLEVHSSRPTTARHSGDSMLQVRNQTRELACLLAVQMRAGCTQSGCQLTADFACYCLLTAV